MYGSAQSGEYFVANEMQISWKKQKEKATEWYALCLCSGKRQPAPRGHNFQVLEDLSAE